MFDDKFKPMFTKTKIWASDQYFPNLRFNILNKEGAQEMIKVKKYEKDKKMAIDYQLELPTGKVFNLKILIESLQKKFRDGNYKVCVLL
mmetsp:Transcript_1867/g.2556  ORF Transcript_1867/g.2556 Transcript_1867/m.2556 type:complete len:89 (-) Transcript_1867:494-760(-)